MKSIYEAIREYEGDNPSLRRLQAVLLEEGMLTILQSEQAMDLLREEGL